ncbi:MAG: Fic family protein [Phycisphaeraceae bacterium]|nr:MAG: Fic family protein [Phycisphaeraceae bacterium]
MARWPNLLPNAPGELVLTSGTEWLPHKAALPLSFEGHAFLPFALTQTIDPDAILKAAWAEIEAANVALAGLDGVARTLPNPHLLANPFRIREAQASSRIENTVASAEEIVLTGTDEVTRNEPREVRNYLEALDHGLRSEMPLNQTLLRGMHQILLSSGVRGHDKGPGQYRIGQVYLQGEEEGFEHARFVPPPAEHVQACMDGLDSFLRMSPPPVPRVVSAALAHYQFETIHPFADGNGRLGRMLIILQICRGGLLSRPLIDISSFFDRHRDLYFDLMLRVTLEGRWLDWILFFCRALAHQADDAEKRAAALLELRRDYIELVTEPRASALLRELVDWLFTRPAVRTADVAKRLEIRPQAAQRHVDRLVEKGILTEVTGRNYNRVYVAKRIVGAIELELPQTLPGAEATEGS